MRAAIRFLAASLLVLGACPGPTPSQLAETPSASAPRRPAEAPAASPSDKDRERGIQQFEDMETAQRARDEASRGPAVKKSPPRPKHGSGQQGSGQQGSGQQGSGQR